jgi:hypothetical protein
MDDYDIVAADPTAPAMGAKSLCIPHKQPELVKGTKVGNTPSIPALSLSLSNPFT